MSDETRDEVTTPEPERPGAFTGSGEGKGTPLVPKNVRKLATRTLILLVAVGAIVFGLQKWQSLKGDIDLGGADTKGAILALELLPEGSRTVVIGKDGAVTESAGYADGQTDRDAVWNPSGNRVFFISDRKAGTTHIYRWNPSRNDVPGQRTADESSRGAISFPVEAVPNADDSALVATRGNIEEFFPVDLKSQRILPPTSREVVQTGGTGGEEGSQGAFQTLYTKLGTSFRVGRWCKGKSVVAAIMRRENGGEVLLLQSIVPNEQGALPRPYPVVAGERIDIDVSPANGDLAFSVTDFDFPTEEQARASVKEGRVQRPFRNALGLIDLSDPANPKIGVVSASPKAEEAFGAPSYSPDGTKLLVTVGAWENSAMKPLGLVAFPARVGAATAGAPIKQGDIYEPSWSPDGTRVVYIRRENGRRTVFVASADGSGETSVTGGKGDFAQPRFSPQR